MCLDLKINRPEDVLAEGQHQGLEWAVMHNGMGYRCGYVRVPAGHPWHGKDWIDVPVDVHGGVSYSQADQPCSAPGPDDAWWIGFDCAHAGDAVDPALPGDHGKLMPLLSRPGDVIRTQEYVEAECRRLCEQAAAAQL